MVLSRSRAIVASLVLLSWATDISVTRADDTAERGAGGRVTLPLSDYRALVLAADAAAARPAERPRAIPERERLALRVVAGRVEVEYELHLHLAAPLAPLELPLSGWLVSASVTPEGAALVRGEDGNLQLIATRTGDYLVRAQVVARLEEDAGVERFELATPLSPAVEISVDLPEALAWEVDGATVVEERSEAQHRHARLAAIAGERVTLALHRVLAAPRDELVAHTTTLLVVESRRDELVRHDAVLYDVARGGIDRFTPRAPAELRPRTVVTDEGKAAPPRAGEPIDVRRERRLAGVGFLVATSSLAADDPLPLASLEPVVAPRARYLAFAVRRAARIELTRPESWRRVDVTDLPATLRDRLSEAALTSAYRFVGRPGDEGEAHTVPFPPTPVARSLVARRETTTLVTAEGRVVHRDRLLLPPDATELTLELVPGAELWSARVGEQPVRPLAEAGRWVVPLLAAGSGGPPTRVEIVTVAPSIDVAARELSLALPVVAGSVIEHQWRLILPEGRRYRFESSALHPAAHSFRAATRRVQVSSSPIAFGDASTGSSLIGTVADWDGEELPGVLLTLSGGTRTLTAVSDAQGAFGFHKLEPGRYELEGALDGFSSIVFPNAIIQSGRNTTIELMMSAAVTETITITAESPLLDSRKLTTGATIPVDEGGGGSYDFTRRSQRRSQRRPPPPVPQASVDLEELRAGLVGGIQPIRVALPENGKVLDLAGVLPPATVEVRLESRREH